MQCSLVSGAVQWLFVQDDQRRTTAVGKQTALEGGRTLDRRVEEEEEVVVVVDYYW